MTKAEDTASPIPRTHSASRSHAERRVPITKGCAVCDSPQHRPVDLALAAGWSARKLAKQFKMLTRRQIVIHKTACLAGDPLRALASEMGYELVDEPEEEMRGNERR